MIELYTLTCLVRLAGQEEPPLEKKHVLMQTFEGWQVLAMGRFTLQPFTLLWESTFSFGAKRSRWEGVR
jgi:hypothetical protein